jgi:hypothetical protein
MRTMLDAQRLEKELDFLDKFEVTTPIVLIWQPPPISITLLPGMGYDDVSEEFRQKTHEASRDGLSSMIRQCDDEIRTRRTRGTFRNEHLETKKVASWCGEVHCRRRAYLDREGNNRYLYSRV